MYQQTERDVSVRQRAVDLLYAMCDRTNAETIVQEMLNYLESADYSIREEMVSGRGARCDSSLDGHTACTPAVGPTTVPAKKHCVAPLRYSLITAFH